MIVVQIVIIVILIVLSALFSSSETALTTITPHRLKTLVDEEIPHAKVLEKVLDQKPKMLSVILVCNNIVNLTASAMATVVVQELFDNKAVSISTGILTLLVLIFGEIVPKTMATVRAERMGLAVAPVIRVLMIVFTPITAALNFLARGVLRLFGVKPEKRAESYTENEIRSIVEVSHEEGVTTSEEKKIINNVFDFTDTVVREIMVPRINVTAVSINSSYEDIMDLFREELFTRYPVYDEEGVNFVGQINVKDLITLRKDQIEHFSIKEILREIDYTYEGKHLSELFLEMKRKRESLMAVLDEYGDLAGIVTMEDILEELVGDIRDEYDEDEELEIVKISDQKYEVQGHVSLDDINEKIGTDFESEDYDSIGGLLIEHLERLPETGDVVVVGNCTVTAKEVDKNVIRIVEILINEP
ncbi:MAG: HlyC/CorC family transporter [Lachnospiraceae bacterium]|nr:HlyC/CorC family transporter [Lachnospiraceae bacterium]